MEADTRRRLLPPACSEGMILLKALADAHPVFTLPHELSALVLQNKRLLYDLLFRASAATPTGS